VELERSRYTDELVRFLKRDYANNLYFFTYINEPGGASPPDPGAGVFVARESGAIILAILISPTHCCVSTSNIDFIKGAARQLPPIESIHILGRCDYTLKFLGAVRGPRRKRKLYSFCKLRPERLPHQEQSCSISASPSDLPDLVRFYQNNGMLVNCETRLPSILGFGTVRVVRQGGNIVSCALTTTETADIAMVGAVFTDESFRNRGFARDCTISLCRDLVERGKEVYLFYETDNLVLASMYRSMGFDAIGSWVLATIA